MDRKNNGSFNWEQVEWREVKKYKVVKIKQLISLMIHQRWKKFFD